jgi:hypothetical protein
MKFEQPKQHEHINSTGPPHEVLNDNNIQRLYEVFDSYKLITIHNILFSPINAKDLIVARHYLTRLENSTRSLPSQTIFGTPEIRHTRQYPGILTMVQKKNQTAYEITEEMNVKSNG